MSYQAPVLRDKYAALLDLHPSEASPTIVYAIFKQSFDLAGRRCELGAPEPLLHDYRDRTAGPKLRAGTDFWPEKQATDLVVRGSAYARDGIGAHEMDVSARLGTREKRIRVFGPRKVRFGSDGKPKVSAPDAFVEMPLVYENAYGGIDSRVRPHEEVSLAQWVAAAAGTDGPGFYPRNPFGKGYSVLPEAGSEIEMPNLEDPSDLLTMEWLVLGDPRAWHRAPLPWCFEYTNPLMFPRFTLLPHAPDAWFPAPTDLELTEVQRGFFAPGLRGGDRTRSHPRFFQEAAHGLVFDEIAGGEPVVIRGMTPDAPEIAFDLPTQRPAIEFLVEGRREVVPTRLHTLLVEPAGKRLHAVYGATITLARTFLPGVHKHIPIAVSFDHDAAIEYVTPPTVRDELGRANAIRDSGH